MVRQEENHHVLDMPSSSNKATSSSYLPNDKTLAGFPRKEDEEDYIKDVEVIVQEFYDRMVMQACFEVVCGMHRMVKTGVYPFAELMLDCSRLRKRHRDGKKNDSNSRKKSSSPEFGYGVLLPRQKAVVSPSSVLPPLSDVDAGSQVLHNEDEDYDAVSSNNNSADDADYTEENSLQDIVTADADDEAGSMTTTTVGTVPDQQVTNSIKTSTRSSSSNNSNSSNNGGDVWGRVPPKEPKITAECHVCRRQVNALRFAVHLGKCMGIGGSSRWSLSSNSVGGGNGIERTIARRLSKM